MQGWASPWAAGWSRPGSHPDAEWRERGLEMHILGPRNHGRRVILHRSWSWRRFISSCRLFIVPWELLSLQVAVNSLPAGSAASFIVLRYGLLSAPRCCAWWPFSVFSDDILCCAAAHGFQDYLWGGRSHAFRFWWGETGDRQGTPGPPLRIYVENGFPQRDGWWAHGVSRARAVSARGLTGLGKPRDFSLPSRRLAHVSLDWIVSPHKLCAEGFS